MLMVSLSALALSALLSLTVVMPVRTAGYNVTGDNPREREALLALYDSTSGSNWNWVTGDTALGLWNDSSTSYCDWFGVVCCGSSPLEPALVPCVGEQSVVVLSLDSFGLVGTVPAALSQLTQLSIMSLAQNPQLSGSLPDALAASLLWLSLIVGHTLGYIHAWQCLHDAALQGITRVYRPPG